MEKYLPGYLVGPARRRTAAYPLNFERDEIMNYHERKELENMELVECWWFALKWFIIVAYIVEACKFVRRITM